MSALGFPAGVAQQSQKKTGAQFQISENELFWREQHIFYFSV